MRAIISVSDKQNLELLARKLLVLGADIYSTGGTLSALHELGIPVGSVTELTGFPEIMEGRIKTLHPGVHAGILARRSNPADLEQVAGLGLGLIDVVAVNLYPFRETVERPDLTLELALENIDIGGPTLLRASAKNFPDVLVLSDPEDYGPALEEWETHGRVSFETRKWLAAKAFAHVSAYDSVIAGFLREDEDLFPDSLTLALEKIQDLRYGENPHQRAALYREIRPGSSGLADRFRQLAGRELSFNNMLDANRAVATVADFLGPTVAIIKHGIPCGLATNEDLVRAYELALAGDPLSAFGGVVGVNRAVTGELAGVIAASRYDIVIAPDFDEEARDILERKRGLRLLAVGTIAGSWENPASSASLDWKRVSGGFLVQTPDAIAPDEVATAVVTERQPTLEETTDLLFAWRAVEHVRSNAIVLAKGLAIVGVGAGQPSRVDAVKLAAMKAGDRAQSSVLASDAFFPFPDGILAAADAGVSAIIQPGGSVKDADVIEAANERGLAMVFTGTRHFLH